MIPIPDAKSSIRAFVVENSGYLTGRVLDFGCGRQPYRDLVSGDYHGYDPNPNGRADYPDARKMPAGGFDAILCTQVIQAVYYPRGTVRLLWRRLNAGGHLLITWNASWYEVEPEDRWRFSRTGMIYLLGGDFIVCEPIVTLQLTGWKLHMTYGAVVKRK